MDHAEAFGMGRTGVSFHEAAETVISSLSST